MVKLSGSKIEPWLTNPDDHCWGVLLYGPNQGLVSVRTRTLINFYSGGSVLNALSVACIDDDRSRANPSAIQDEAFAQSLLGGSTVLWIREIAEKFADEIQVIVEGTIKPNTLIVEAGDLSPRSKIRRIFERADNVVSIGCYEDDAHILRKIIKERFTQLNITASKSAIETLLARLGKDRLSNLSEIDKICLFAGRNETLGEESVSLLVGEGHGLFKDELTFAIFNGQRSMADNLLRGNIDAGLMPLQFIRQLQSHIEKLLTVRAAMNLGERPNQAISKLRPPVFFKFKNDFRQQVQVWPVNSLQKCMRALIELEVDCKSTGMPDIALCQRLCLSISGLANKLTEKQL